MELGIMEISEEIIDIVETIRNYRIDKELLETLKSENEVLKKQNNEYRKILNDLQLKLIDRNKLLDHVNDLNIENSKLKLNIDQLEDRFDFIVTTPNSTRTVYGEIKENLFKAKKEVLVCSPWINYLLDEFKEFDKNIKLKIITNFRKEDIEKGITDIDKIRVFLKHGAQVRYNNDLHAKMIFIDSDVAIISSAKLTQKGLTVNYEAGVVIRDPPYVKNALEFFNGIWKESEPLTENILKELG